MTTVSHGDRHVGEAVAVLVREAEEQEDRDVGEQHVPLQRHREWERRDDEQVEADHDATAITVSHGVVENNRTSGATISTTVPATCARRRRAPTDAGRSGSRGSAPA